ncbi:MAG: oligosaccharide flippase family protein, partial [Ginsengibacter sp.]
GKKIDPGKLFSFSILWTFIIGFLILMMYPIAGLLELKFFDRILLVYAIVFVCGNLLITFLNSFFYSENNYRLPNVTGIAINCGLIILLLLTGKNTWLDDETFVLLYFGSFLLYGIALAVCFLALHGSFLKFSFLSLIQLRTVFKYCLLAFASNVITFLYYRIDYWFVQQNASPTDLGNYIQVSKIVQMFFVLPGVLAAVVFPVTASGRRKEVNELVKMISRSVLFFYGVACLLLLVVGRWLFPLIFGESFNEMYVPFLLLIPGILSLSALYTLTAYYAGKNRVIVNLKGSLITLGIITVGDAILIPVYGINAAAAVSSVGYMFYYAYILSVFCKEYDTSLADFFIFKFSDISRIKNTIMGKSHQAK